MHKGIHFAAAVALNVFCLHLNRICKYIGHMGAWYMYVMYEQMCTRHPMCGRCSRMLQVLFTMTYNILQALHHTVL